MKPLLKWAGGKAKLVQTIMTHFPESFNRYYEPFVGGGSMFLQVSTHTIIGDANAFLINFYRVVKDDCDQLFIELQTNGYINEKNVYLVKRERFNTLKESWGPSDRIELAALFLYLNKCGYNGMYRENSKGKFNIPFGNMKLQFGIINKETLDAYSIFLKTNDIDIRQGDYKECLVDVQKGDLVYMDPPYFSTFTGYTSNGFSIENQRQLKEYIEDLTNKGVNVILSNSNTEFIRELYKDYTIIEIPTRYSIGGKGASREKGVELLLFKTSLQLKK